MKISEALRARIAELTAERAAYQTEATARLVGYAAVIGELERWLARLEGGVKQDAQPPYTNDVEVVA